MKCPYCKEELPGKAKAVGIYEVPEIPDDMAKAGKGERVYFRMGGQFQVLAMAECPACGGISFNRIDSIKDVSFMSIKEEKP